MDQPNCALDDPTRVFLRHGDPLEHLAGSGQAWAHEALEPDALFLFGSSAGVVEESFREVPPAPL